MSNHHIFYYGQECPHCHKMLPLIDKLEQELDIQFDKKETWHNPENKKQMELHNPDGNLCAGVPFIYNSKSKKYICGAVDYDALKEWVLQNQN